MAILPVAVFFSAAREPNGRPGSALLGSASRDQSQEVDFPANAIGGEAAAKQDGRGGTR
jgi:hypothetical protein